MYVIHADGYRVHGTVRNPDDPNKVKHLTELPGAKGAQIQLMIVV